MQLCYMHTLRGSFSLISIHLWFYHNIYCACKFLCCHQTPKRGILKEHALSLVFCVFDNNTWIRILPNVLNCVGISFSTMDDDPPYVLVLYLVHLSWVYDLCVWWKRTCEEEAILLMVWKKEEEITLGQKFRPPGGRKFRPQGAKGFQRQKG